MDKQFLVSISFELILNFITLALFNSQKKCHIIVTKFWKNSRMSGFFFFFFKYLFQIHSLMFSGPCWKCEIVPTALVMLFKFLLKRKKKYRSIVYRKKIIFTNVTNPRWNQTHNVRNHICSLPNG